MFYEFAKQPKGQCIHFLDHRVAVWDTKASGKATSHLAFLRQSGAGAGLGIPKAHALLGSCAFLSAASMLHFSEPGIMADFMPYINPNNVETFFHDFCNLYFSFINCLSISFAHFLPEMGIFYLNDCKSTLYIEDISPLS